MNPENSSWLSQILHSRRDAVAESWVKAIGQTSSVPYSTAEVRERLAELTDDAIALLLTEPFEQARAEAIGASLVNMHFVQPHTLGGTLSVLGEGLLEGLPADQVAGLHPRLVTLLAAIATAFFEQGREWGPLYDDGGQQIGVQGSERWLEHWSQPIRSGLYAGGRIEHYTNITECKRVEEQLYLYTEQLEALRHVSLELTAQLDLDTLLHSIVSRALELLGATIGSIFLLQPDQDVLQLEVVTGIDWPLVKALVLQKGEGVAGKVWKTGRPIIVDNYHRWEGRLPGTYDEYPFAAVVGVPIRLTRPGVEGEFLGVLNVLADPPRTFSQANAELLELFAAQAAIAIQNARLFEQARHEIAERERAERALRESEERYRMLFENAPIGLGLANIEGSILAYNQAMLEPGGYTQEDIAKIGNVAHLYSDPEQRARVLAIAQRQGFVHRHETRLKRKDGTSYDALLSLTPVMVEGQRCWQAMVEDITERKRAAEALQRAHDELETRVQERTAELAEANEQLQAEINIRARMAEALQESEATARALLEAPTDSVLLLDPAGIILDANETSARRLGLPADELAGQCMFDLHPPDLAESRRVQLNRVFDSGKPTRFEDERTGMWFDNVIYPVFDARGEVTRAAVVARDITERKQAEEALRHHAEQLEALRQVGLELAAELDLDSLLRSIVSQAINLLGGIWGSLRLYRPEQDLLEQAVAVGPSYLPAIESVLRRGQGISGRILETGEPLNVDDYQNWDGWAAPWDTRPFRAVVGVPVWRGEEFLGALTVVADRPGASSQADAELLNLFAAQAAIAIQNARLYAAERQAHRTAETLRAANAALSQSLDLDSVLETLLDYMGQLVPYDSASVHLMETDSRMAIQAMRGYEQWTDPEQIRTIAFDIHTNPLTRELVTTRRGVLVNDIKEHPGWEHRPGTEYIRSCIHVPLVAGGQVIGSYGVDKAEANFFTEEHRRLAEALAGQAAVAIQNARLYEQVHAGREQLQHLARQIVTAEEEERRRLSRELHDEAGQALTALKISLELIREDLPAELESLRRRISEAAAWTSETMEQIRLLAQDLRPPALDAVGLTATLEDLCNSLAQRTDLSIEFVGRETPVELPGAVTICLYRALQEALTNVARHAQANQVWVALRCDTDNVSLSVEDDGRGFDQQDTLSDPSSSTGVGLKGIRERLSLLGGRLGIESQPGQGSRLVAHIPTTEILHSPCRAAERRRKSFPPLRT